MDIAERRPTCQGPGEARHDVEAITACATGSPQVQVHQLQDLVKQELVDQVQTANGEIFGHLLLNEMDGVLNVEPYYFAQRNVI